MSRGVVIAIGFGREWITAQSRIDSRVGQEWCWEAPPQRDGPAFCGTEEGHALVLEALALMHFPNVDLLVLALPAGEVQAHRAGLEQAFLGSHDVRNTECRSQRLALHVRRVAVVPQPVNAFLRDGPAADSTPLTT